MTRWRKNHLRRTCLWPVLHALAGDTTAYLGFITGATVAQPARIEPWVELGALHETAGRFGEAINAYGRAFPLGEDHPGLAARLASVFARAGRPERARDLYLQVIDRDSEDSDAFYNLGVMHDALGEVDRAMGAYRRALELDPGHVDARLNLSIDLPERESFEEALRNYLLLLDLPVDQRRRRQVERIVDQLQTAQGED